MFEFGKNPGHRPVLLRSVASAAFGLALLFAAPARAETVQVTIDNFVFGPNEITVKPGDTVTWTNRDDIPHNVRAAAGTGTWKCSVMDTGGTCDITFKDVGEFPYFCALHPHMTGKVIVKAN
jgi:plastocyanin